MDIRRILVEWGCMLEGDWLIALKSGRVSQKYINFDAVLPYYEPMFCLGSSIATLVNKSDLKIEVISTPAVGAIPLAYAVQECMSDEKGCRPPVVFAEKTIDNDFSFQRRKFADIVNGKSVLVVEDVGNTGHSAKRTAMAVTEAGGKVVLVVFVWNRGKVTSKKLGFPVASLIEEEISSCRPEEHPLWGELPLVNNIGHPEHFPGYPREIKL